MPRTLALDVGKIRIGVAITDPLGYTAQPLLTLWRKSHGEDAERIIVVVGYADVIGNHGAIIGNGQPA